MLEKEAGGGKRSTHALRLSY